MPLIYNSIESEHQGVQEKVLKSVPHLTEILDYGTVHNVLLVKVAVSIILRGERVFQLMTDALHQDKNTVGQGTNPRVFPCDGQDT